MFLLQKKFFGLDISDLSLKVAQTYKTKEGFVVSAFGFCDIPSGIIEKGELKNEQALSKLILNCLKDSQGEGIKTKNVVCSLPEERSFVDVFQVPFIEEKEQLEQIVLTEAENRIPFPLSEVYYDFEVIIDPKEVENKIGRFVVTTIKKDGKIVGKFVYDYETGEEKEIVEQESQDAQELHDNFGVTER